MKKLTLFLGAVAAFSLLALNANASAPEEYTAITVTGVGLLQTNNPFEVKHSIEKVKVDNDYVLYAIDQEFDTSYAKEDGGSGYKLLIDSIWAGSFYVADKDGNVFGPYSENEDDYELNFRLEARVTSLSGNTASTIANGRLLYESGNGDVEIKLAGKIKIKDKLSSGNESFQMNHVIGNVDADEIEGIATGNVSGSGKDNIGLEP